VCTLGTALQQPAWPSLIHQSCPPPSQGQVPLSQESCLPTRHLGLFKTASCQVWWLTPVIPVTRGRDQEDHGSKPAPANSSRDPISKKPITKKGWWSGSRCRSWVQTPVPQNNNKKFSMLLSHGQQNTKLLLDWLFFPFSLLFCLNWLMFEGLSGDSLRPRAEPLTPRCSRFTRKCSVPVVIT
jgi:hypothetical protein